VLCYDTTQPDGLKDLPKWLSDVRESAPAHARTIVVGCKTDLTGRRAISRAAGSEAVRALSEESSDPPLLWGECSAKRDRGVVRVLRRLTAVCWEPFLEHLRTEAEKEGRVAPPPPASTHAPVPGGGWCTVQ
jgi:hypothetical protein